MERRMSDASRKVLEKQLQLLSERNGEPSGPKAMAIIKLVELLEEDDHFRKRDERLDAYFEHLQELDKEQELNNIRERESVERHRAYTKRLILFSVGLLVLLVLLGSLLFWLI